MRNLIIAALVCVFIATLAEAGKVPKPKDDVKPKTIQGTPACLASGGLCIEASECPEGKLAAERGLCSDMGSSLECCHDVGRNVRDCRQRGGTCMPTARCGKAPRQPLGICPVNGEECCVLVH